MSTEWWGLDWRALVESFDTIVISPPPLCAYCGKARRLTKEHLVPKSVGGTLTIRVCRPCNQARGASGTHDSFRAYIRAHPGEWSRHVKAARRDKGLFKWLVSEGLIHAPPM